MSWVYRHCRLKKRRSHPPKNSGLPRVSKCDVSHPAGGKSPANRLNETRNGASAPAASNHAVKAREDAGKKASKNVRRVKSAPREKTVRRVVSVRSAKTVHHVKRASKAVSEAGEEGAVEAAEAVVGAVKAGAKLAVAALASDQINVAMKAVNASNEVSAVGRIVVARREISTLRAKQIVKSARRPKRSQKALPRSQYHHRSQFAKNHRSRRP